MYLLIIYAMKRLKQLFIGCLKNSVINILYFQVIQQKLNITYRFIHMEVYKKQLGILK